MRLGAGSLRSRGTFIAVTAVFGAVFVAALFYALRTPWWPVSDHAIIADGVADVGSHTPLTGAFSRYGWRHPGPWLLWLLAPLHKLTGTHPNALLAGALLINTAAVLATLTWVWRRFGVGIFSVTAVGLALVVRTLGTSLISDPWNPWVPLLPFALFLFLCWDLARGHRWALPAVVGVGSFVVQCHLGYLVPVPMIAGWALLAALVMDRRDTDTDTDTDTVERTWLRDWAKPLATTAVVGLVLWAPPLVEQVRGEPGNMRAILQFFLNGTDEAVNFAGSPAQLVGPNLGAGLLSREVVAFPWAGGVEPVWFAVEPLPPLYLVPVALILVAVVTATWRARDRDMLLGLGTAIVALVAEWIRLTRTVGDAGDYLVRPAWMVAMFATVTVVCATGRLLWPRLRERVDIRLVTGAAVVVVAVLGITTIVQGNDRPQPAGEFAAAMDAVVGPVTDAVSARGARSVVVTSAGNAGSVEAGLVHELARHGIDARSGQLFEAVWPPHRRESTGSPELRIEVVTDENTIAERRRAGGFDEVAAYTPTDAERLKSVEPIVVFVGPNTTTS